MIIYQLYWKSLYNDKVNESRLRFNDLLIAEKVVEWLNKTYVDIKRYWFEEIIIESEKEYDRK